MRSMLIGATGMQAQELNVEVISNNIANISTTGFKRQRAEFQDMIYDNIRRPGSTSTDAGNIVPTGIQVGMGVRPAAVYRINTQGNVTITDNPLDLSVSGRGYFQVLLPDGSTAYTRAGSMQLNAEGVIVNADGYPLQPAITIPNTAIDVTINSSGQVEIKQDGTTALTSVGQFQLANFVNPAGLEAVGNNLLKETPASGTATTAVPASAGFGEIRQGTIENSNVNVVSEITSLITAQRAYEMNSRVIKASDEMLSTVSQLR
ncbi:MAG: flagellar basal-body rod protein FlgG [Alphaproteobacteria bacterium]|nr:flagellar basal-body rod protein FlgG [Alphaproteobacteria bacterium]